MKNLYVKGHQVSLVNENSDPIDINLNKYVDHSSIFKIKEYFNKSTESNFLEITPNDIKKEIKSLDSSEKRVHLKILLQNISIKCKIYVRHYKIYIPRKLYKKDFSKESHLFFLKNNIFLVKNYRPVSVLPTVFKIFERIMQKQIVDYINQYLLHCYVGTEKASLHK